MHLLDLLKTKTNLMSQIGISFNCNHQALNGCVNNKNKTLQNVKKLCEPLPKVVKKCVRSPIIRVCMFAKMLKLPVVFKFH